MTDATSIRLADASSRSLFEDGHLEVALGQNVGHFHADVAGADDDGLFRPRLEGLFDVGAVAEFPQQLDAGEIESVER